MNENYLIGTCLTMCPAKEMKLREKEKLLHAFEIMETNQRSKTPRADPNKMVKSYARSAAGQSAACPFDLRPYPVLLATVHYLITDVLPLYAGKPVLVYDFVFDRLRAVRQDMVIQNLPPQECVKLLEPIVWFHVYFGYILCENKDVDIHINNSHLQECLKRLLVCYDECPQAVNVGVECLYIINNLGDHEALRRGFHLKHRSKTSYPTLQISLEASMAWYLGNYVRAVKHLVLLPPLLLCAASQYVPKIRFHAFRLLSNAFSCTNCKYPMSNLEEILLFDDCDAVIKDLQFYNIKWCDGYVNFSKKDFHTGIAVMKPSMLIFINNLFKSFNISNLLLGPNC